MSRFRIWLRPLAATMLLASAAQAQPAPTQPTPASVPEALRGAWFAGACADPEAMLLLTARAAARLEAEEPARLYRFRQIRLQDGWTIGTAGGAEAPRLMLRPTAERLEPTAERLEPAAERLETAEPEAKLREDRLPGDSVVAAWHRCPAPPVALAAVHGEGAAFLAALEHLEAGCGSGTPGACAAAIVAQADVSGDGRLSVAELARLLRGAAWVAAVQEGATQDVIAAAVGAGGLAGILAARLLMESLDYDGDGRISAAELAQDRVGFATAPGTAAGRPLRMDGLTEGAGMLRGLMEGLADWR
ncbi:EF-hand domain-containing protein [Falsiroseomonas sp. E2-1-a4]|uniref:EF-hand domain-containing protein n=1 Tax=Falsiroseomonas sp. E2-1-a4 TaxID=3239299 RepID=UPI003F2F4264